MRRLFLAASLPEDLTSSLLMMQQTLAEHALSLKLMAEHNLHLTLRFLGQCSGEQIEQVKAWLAELSLPEMQGEPCRLGGLDSFLGRDGLTVYAAVQASAALINLQADLEQGLRDLGFPKQTRPFVPHVTLARKVQLQKALPGAEKGSGQPFMLKQLVLFGSFLEPQGPHYQVLCRRSL